MSSSPSKAAWLQCTKQSIRDSGWAPSLVFAIHLVALEVFDAYSRIAYLDLLMHFIGGAVMAYFLHAFVTQASSMENATSDNPMTNRILVFIGTITVAVLWEFAEFMSDQFLATHTQAGLDDTLSDLLFGAIGAAFFISLTILQSWYPDLALAQEKLPHAKSIEPRE
jgi:hypothetical protein